MDASDMYPVGRDSFVVIDASIRRAVVMNAAMQPVRHVSLPLVPLGGMVGSWPSAVFASGTVNDPDHIGWPLHQLSFRAAEGAVIKSFGSNAGELRPAEMATAWHSLAPSRNGSFWAAYYYTYDVELWSRDARLMSRFRRRPAWFHNGERSTIGWKTQAPGSFLVGVEEDSLGNLWLFTHTASPTWQEGWPATMSSTAELPSSRIALEKLFETMVEVIDPRTASVVVRRRLNGYVVAAMPGQQVLTYAISADGHEVLTIARLHVTGLPGLP